jgi:hypothetical protein
MHIIYFTYTFLLTGYNFAAFIAYTLMNCMLYRVNKNDETREIELLRDLGHLLREIMEMTEDEVRQTLDRAESNQDDQPQTM